MLNRVLGMAIVGALLGATGMTATGHQRRWIYPGEQLIGKKGAGVTVAQAKRVARKARNVKRHKAACRG